MASSITPLFLLLLVSVSVTSIISPLIIVASAANFYQDFAITWGDGRAKILDNGNLLTLYLDKTSGSGFQSKSENIFAKIDMQLKLAPGNCHCILWSTWDEIDFEFLGNLSGDPYVVHTNVFSQGKGNREQQFYLWFDPTAHFHTYSILWSPLTIVYGIPIREFENMESNSVPFPKSPAMRIYSSLWNADDWAKRGGLVKTDWSQAPFTASYRNFNANACVWFNGASSCGTSSYNNEWLWVQQNYMIYNYCSDLNRFPQGLPLECTI